MFKERIVATACIAIAAIAILGASRPPSPNPGDDTKPRHTGFFIAKTRQPPVYDGVIVGDSRGLQGISPEEISAFLPGEKIYNFCFHAGGMNPEIYRHAEELLAPTASQPMILLAPTSLSLLPDKSANEQYHEFRTKPRDQVWLHTRLFDFAFWLRPLRISSLAYMLTGMQPKNRLIQTFHPSGWIETDQIPHSKFVNLDGYADRFVGHSCDRELLQALFTQTAAWTRQGIEVFAVFPPAHSPRIAIEDSMLGFDRQAFASAFEDAGGVMLTVDDSGYQTYDGSHLTGPSARLFSRRLGQAIASLRQH